MSAHAVGDGPQRLGLDVQAAHERVHELCFQRVPGLVRFYDTDSLPRLVEVQGLTVIECKGDGKRVSVLARA